jgi:hypothetical protein
MRPDQLGAAPLGVPDLEAADVELKGSRAGSQSSALHQQVFFRKNSVAGDAHFLVAGTTPDPGDAVMRQTSVAYFSLDEQAEYFGIHLGLSPMGRREQKCQIHLGLDAPERQPMRPRCRRIRG